MPSRLFALPEYHQATAQFMISAVRVLMNCKEPVLRQIRSRAVGHAEFGRLFKPNSNFR